MGRLRTLLTQRRIFVCACVSLRKIHATRLFYSSTLFSGQQPHGQPLVVTATKKKKVSRAPREDCSAVHVTTALLTRNMRVMCNVYHSIVRLSHTDDAFLLVLYIHIYTSNRKLAASRNSWVVQPRLQMTPYFFFFTFRLFPVPDIVNMRLQ